MGECVSSICERQKEEYNEEEDDTNNILDKTKNPKVLGNIKKKEAQIPKNAILDEDEDDDIVVPKYKHISDTSVIKSLVNMNISQNKEIQINKDNSDIKEKIEKARKNWEKLVDKLIQKRIEI